MSSRSDLIQELNVALRELSALSILHSQSVAHRIGLNASDLESLDLVCMCRVHTPTELMEQTGLTSGAITGVIDRLERKGYVVRKRDKIDRRKILLNATKRVQVDVEPLAEGMRKSVSAALGAHDTAALKTTLVVMIDLLDAARAAIRDLQVDPMAPRP
ncbi:MarR family transcriptional regulator [Bradyrhizobium jicamae]|uniref:MarR family winged helix-turn-helix transcriptional regulator n=1 Tax=Bradyrhizobium jicamae TaxID=280332 RepID=UPI001BA5BE0D|nr:MarR family transcriptional regulator [Bradyrhizobium jicamae]MBR0755319.1 MarR family transcriptional regulator [Bradyrhizobium jicamae]